MDAKTRQSTTNAINLGAPVCYLIKQTYFPNETWLKCYKQVSKMFTELKRKAKIYYPSSSDTEILQNLNKLSKEYMEELFNMDGKSNETLRLDNK